MASTVQHKRSETASAAPASEDIAVGELAINLTDKRLFSKKTDGTIVSIGGIDVDDSGGVATNVQGISLVDTIDGVFTIDTSVAGIAAIRLNNTADRDYGLITDPIGDYETLDMGGLS